MGTGDMVRMMHAASEFNRGQGITGMLAFDQASFLQSLEGGAQAVNSLYHRIARDPRHQRMTLLCCGEVVEREFADWSMTSLDICGTNSSARVGALRRCHGMARFEPSLLRAESALCLLSALSDEVLPACLDASLESDAIARAA